MPAFSEENKRVSLLGKFLTSEIWEEYKEKKDESGYSFKDAIYPACKYPETMLGVFAGCRDSYKSFSKLMIPIIKELHFNGGSPVAHTIDVDETKIPVLELADMKGMIVRTEMRIRRNFISYPFQSAMDNSMRQELETKI